MDLLFSYLCAFSSTLATSVLLSILEAVRPFASLMSDQRCQCDRLNHGRRIRPLLNEKTYSNSEKNHWDLLKSSGSHGLLICFYICTRKLSIIHERHHCIMLNQKCKSLATWFKNPHLYPNVTLPPRQRHWMHAHFLGAGKPKSSDDSCCHSLLVHRWMPYPSHHLQV